MPGETAMFPMLCKRLTGLGSIQISEGCNFRKGRHNINAFITSVKNFGSQPSSYVTSYQDYDGNVDVFQAY